MDIDRSVRRRRRTVLLLVLACLMWVGACAPEEEPTTTTTPIGAPSSPTDEGSPAEEETWTPPDIDQPIPSPDAAIDDLIGAAAFAEYFFAVVNYSLATLNPGPLERISDPDCGFCETHIRLIERMAEEGGWYDGWEYSVTDVRVQYPSEGSSEYIVRFVLDETEATMYRGDGTEELLPGFNYPNAALGATWTGERFIVSGVNGDTTNTDD